MLHYMYTAYLVVSASAVSSNTLQYVRIDVLTSVTVKTTGLWDITMCSLYEFSGISEEHIAPILCPKRQCSSVSCSVTLQ